MTTNVLYDRYTKAVIAIEYDGTWMIPDYCELATFKDGVEPVLIETNHDRIYIKPNALIITPDYLE